MMLLSTVRKVLTAKITRRNNVEISEYVRESQAGFRKGRLTAGGVFYTRCMCERALLGDWDSSAAQLDSSGAFDTVSHGKAIKCLLEAELPICPTLEYWF